MTVSPVRVGWLGAGFIAQFHSKMLRSARPDVVWAGVYDPDAVRAEQFAAASGARFCASIDEVLAGCDAVYVCTWTSTHLELVQAALDRGVAVFCEKPLAPDLETARDLTQRVIDSGLVNQVGLVLRRSPAFALARSLIGEADAGQIASFVFRDDQFIPIRGMYGSTWRADAGRAGSGTLLEHSIHDVDIIEFVMGPIESVMAEQSFVHGIEGIEDVVASVVRLGSGGVGGLVSVWHDIDARPSDRRLEVFCERRHVVVEGDWFGPVHWTDADGTSSSVEGSELLDLASSRGITAGNPDADFVAAVAAGEPAWPDVSTALRAHQVVDAIYRSCRSGARQAVAPSPGQS